MKLEVARGLFLVGALSVTALATAAWQEPAPQIVDTVSCADQQCAAASSHPAVERPVSADSDNLVLLIFGLSQAMKGEQ